MNEITRNDRLITKRNVLKSVGSAVLVSSLTGSAVAAQDSTRAANDSAVTISFQNNCSGVSVEATPPDGETWTIVVELLGDDSEVIQYPEGGQTVTGGTANLELSMSRRIRRVFVAEGPDPDGPLVAEKTCGKAAGSEGQSDSECSTATSSGTGGGSAASARSESDSALNDRIDEYLPDDLF